MKPFWLGTNWKMNKNFKESDDYLKALLVLTAQHPHYQYCVIPPHTHLRDAAQMLNGSPILLGAQNAHWKNAGPYTGEISPLWLRELGVELVELGHSERRQYNNETDETVNRKVHAVLGTSMKALVCIGETAKDKHFGITKEVLCRQLKIALFGVPREQVCHLLIAYEPVWAIGEQGVPAAAHDVEAVHAILREQLLTLFGEAGRKVPLLYGGSISPENCVEIASLQQVNGLFIGRSAWDIHSFEAIINRLEHAGIA